MGNYGKGFSFPEGGIIVNTEDYKMAENVLDAVSLFFQTRKEYVYIVDLSRGEIVFASENLCLLCDKTKEEIKEMGYEFYTRFIPEEDLKKIEELRQGAFELFAHRNDIPKAQYCISFNFHFRPGKTKILFHHRAVPFMRDKDGHVWMVICSFYPASQKDTGNAIIHCPTSPKYFQYDFQHREWVEQQKRELTDNEKAIIILSAQGYTEKEIASITCKSHNTIKTYKRHLFDKIGVTNITGALMYYLNHDLL